MMMIFGMFVFSIPTATYQQLQRTTTWKHPSNSRVGDMPAYQFTGKGEDVITLDGTIVPEFGSQLSLTALRLMGDTGKSFPLIAGNGKIYGLWVLKSVNETQSYFFKDGTPRKIEFTLTLEKTTTAGVLIGNVLGSVLEGVL
ncbi:phage tail protein [Acinetobacter baumannii]|uniref:phage tail protein n=1 Tax=Acinetobacter TaxID=469 RepID=UPI0003B8DC7F|nr:MULTISPECIES: phage tail protein [Acinetobacter]AXX46046.1 oxidoreductase [Acinetobacter baumannii]EHT1074228.1 phage tail protein [Acinetobacter baumannii]EHU1429305.1 phage tail protein [Acinetobacter baumannii]EHU1559133.1 phage tail protein [Acinetobacter baumannii]EHU2510202.1 phage tail protein [Acinetobacter baumannii]